MTTRPSTLPRSVVAALAVIVSAVTLGCAALLAAAKWPGAFVLVPIGCFLMAGGGVAAGMIVLLDRGLKAAFRVLGVLPVVAGLLAFAATASWLGATWHRF